MDRCAPGLMGGQVCPYADTGGQLCSWLILLALTLVSYNKQITGLGFYLIMELKFQKVISKIIIAYILK